ncbi:MAG: hypothetical protein LBM66_02915 [Bifidobacteriaceae bacterium]|jgi:DNA-binding beta-propeller fold protein YncE|nr:hypothetical protein [Bifidobacteriaceae bacterium]
MGRLPCAAAIAAIGLATTGLATTILQTTPTAANGGSYSTSESMTGTNPNCHPSTQGHAPVSGYAPHWQAAIVLPCRIDPYDVTVDNAGDTMAYSDTTENNIYIYNVNGPSLTLRATITDVVNPMGLVMSPDGQTLYATDFFHHTVNIYSLAGAPQLIGYIEPTVDAQPINVSLSPDGSRLYVADIYDAIVRVYLTATPYSPIQILTGFTEPAGIGVGPEGRIYVSDMAANTVSVFAPTDPPTRIAVLTGLNSPRSLKVDANGYLYVANSGISPGTNGGGPVTPNQSNLIIYNTNLNPITPAYAVKGLTSPTGFGGDAWGNFFLAETEYTNGGSPSGSIWKATVDTYPVSGRVVDAATGQPLHATVTAHRGQFMPSINAVTTNANGEFTLPRVAWGFDTYFTASAPNYASARIGPTSIAGPTGGLTLRLSRNAKFSDQPVYRVRLGQSALRLATGQKAKVPAVPYAQDGHTVKAAAKWKSSKKAVASITKSGTVKAVKPGKAVITIKAGKKSAKYTVTVVAKAPTGAAATVKALKAKGMKTKLKAGTTRYLTATWKGNAVKVIAKYSSSKHSVASVDKVGTLVARKAGKAVITVKAGAVKKKYSVKVAKK